MKEGEIIKVDIEQVLRARCPGAMRFIPNGVVSRLKKLICQDDLNRLLEENVGLEGADFCRGVLVSLGVKVNVCGAELLPDKNHRRVVLVSNHPLGGLDGMALIDMVQRHFGGQVWFVVNDLLMAIKPLESVFLPINKFGRQSREVSRKIDEAFAGNDPILIFPAGLVSRYRRATLAGRSVKMVCDLEWNKMFVTRSAQFKRDVVPLFFDGNNSLDFYKKANLRKRLHIKFNLEQALLPREMFRSRGKTFTITVGQTHSHELLPAGGREARECADAIRNEVYMLKPDFSLGKCSNGKSGETSLVGKN